jgi:hypothetical protein
MHASAEPPGWVARLRASRWWAWPWHLVLLAGWMARWYPEMASGGGHSWHLFAEAGSLFIGGHPAGFTQPGGLDIYASYPRFQFGPVTLAVAAAARLGPDEGVVAAQLLMAACGLAVLYLAERTARVARPDLDPERIRWAVLGAGTVFVPAWMILAVSFAHLDDVLALLFAVLAVRALARGRAAQTGIMLALSAGAKPWAFAFMALLLALPAGTGRLDRSSPRWRAVAWAAGITLLLWAPFLIADPGSVTAARYAIPNVKGSGLRALGVNSATTPPWDRAAQILLGFALAAAAIWRGRWPAVLLICVAVRVALDPNTYPYYDAGPMVGALVWDLMGSRHAVPAWSLATGSLFWGWTAVGGDATLSGDLRVGFALAAAAFTILGPAALPAPQPGRMGASRGLAGNRIDRLPG